MVKYKMSAHRLDELKAELDYLQTVREKEVAELIKEARSYGDLSENSEYDEAKTEQGMLYSKIAELKNLIDHAEIIEKTTETDRVSLGATVTVIDLETEEEECYKIVGSQEADPLNGMISEESPFGSGLMNKQVGEEVVLEVPAGILKFKVVEIEFLH